MKGAPGLILAIFLGLVGAALNWIYLENKTKDVDSVSFLGIKDSKPGAEVALGHPLRRSHFVEVKIPRRHANNLKDVAYLYEDRATLENTLSTQEYEGGELVFRSDYRTPPAELKLEPNEEFFCVPVDSRKFVPSLFNPGDWIDFEFPASTPQATRTPSEPQPSSDAAAAFAPPERIGPFRIKSLGDRLGTLEVMKASRRAPMQERQLGIVIDTKKPEEVERAARLRARLARGDYRNIDVILLGKK
jgi:hypothetical protein